MHKPESTQGNSVVCWNIYGTVVRTVRTTTLGIAVVVYWRALCYYDVIRKDSSVIRTAPNKNSAKRSENTKTRRHVVEALTFSCAIGFFQHCDVIIVLQYDLYVLRTSYVRWRWFACRPYSTYKNQFFWHGTGPWHLTYLPSPPSTDLQRNLQWPCGTFFSVWGDPVAVRTVPVKKWFCALCLVLRTNRWILLNHVAGRRSNKIQLKLST